MLNTKKTTRKSNHGSESTYFDSVTAVTSKTIVVFIPALIVRLPYGLGCGLAGGDWDTVLDIISDAAKAWNLNVEIWELQK
jgi:hypothetical protein